MGYHQAGFEMTGVDNRPQPRYPFEFVQADALEYVAEYGQFYDFIHASPPCQAHVKGLAAVNRWLGRALYHTDLIGATRELLRACGKPYVIENVPRAPLLSPVTICGRALGCNVKRHRLFESNMLLYGTTCPPGHPGDWLLVFGHTVLNRGHVIGRSKGGGPPIKRTHQGTDAGREAMGIPWMTRDELSEAIPPAYTEFIGEQLMWHLEGAA